MAQPLTQSYFKPTDFDKFIDELGLNNLSPRSRIEFVDKIRQAVEFTFITKLFRRLSEDKKIKLVELMQEADKTGNEAPVNEFLETEFPDVEGIVDEAIDKIKNDLRLSTASIADSFEQVMADLGKQIQPARPDDNPPSEANLPEHTEGATNTSGDETPTSDDREYKNETPPKPASNNADIAQTLAVEPTPPTPEPDNWPKPDQFISSSEPTPTPLSEPAGAESQRPVETNPDTQGSVDSSTGINEELDTLRNP